MIYMTILGLIALLSLKVGIGSINQLASESGDHPELSALLAVVAFTALDWGFIDNGEWKQHEQYLAERYKG
jgi:hypothetical protein